MKPEVTIQKMNQFLDCQKSCSQGGDIAAGQGQFLTISRQTGAGGITISEKVSEILNKQESFKGQCPWTVFDQNLVDVILDEHNLPAWFRKYMPEKKISEIRDTFEELCGVHPSSMTFLRDTRETIMHLASMGHSIIVGRGANIVTAKLQKGLHVRIVAPYDKRLAHIQKYYEIDADKSREFIKDKDAGRRKYLKEYYGKDIDDQGIYDIVVNTGRVSFDEASHIIANVLIDRQGKGE